MCAYIYISINVQYFEIYTNLSYKMYITINKDVLISYINLFCTFSICINPAIYVKSRSTKFL